MNDSVNHDLDPRPARRAAWCFVLLLVAVPVSQIGWEISGDRERLLARLGPAFRSGRPAQFEEDVARLSWLREVVVPWYQWGLSELLGHGNEKALEGRDSWLYYSDDVELVSGPGYLDPRLAGARALEVIAEFRDQLALKDVELLVLPLPVKGMIDADRLRRPASAGWPNNADHAGFFAGLRDRGIAFIDLYPWMLDRQSAGPQFLPRDTHWTPETMEAVAAVVAQRIEEMIGPTERPVFQEVETAQMEVQGDLVKMLRLARPCRRYPPMELSLRRVSRLNGDPWKPSQRSELVLLGDSFTGAFSDPRLGLGTSAGFAEHLSLALQRPLDVIAMPGSAATMVRRALARRPAGLAGKRLVLWEFALRSVCDAPATWRSVSFGGTKVVPEAAEGSLSVRAKIVELSRVPKEFDYERCLAVFEYVVIEGEEAAAAGDRLWVGHLAVEDHRDTPQARYQVGDVHDLHLEPIGDHYDLEQESWVDDTLVEGPVWWPVDH